MHLVQLFPELKLKQITDYQQIVAGCAKSNHTLHFRVSFKLSSRNSFSHTALTPQQLSSAPDDRAFTIKLAASNNAPKP